MICFLSPGFILINTIKINLICVSLYFYHNNIYIYFIDVDMAMTVDKDI